MLPSDDWSRLLELESDQRLRAARPGCRLAVEVLIPELTGVLEEAVT
jgi:hypothetical protein